MGNAAPQCQAHIGRQQDMIFGHCATGDQHGGDGDNIAQGNAFGQQRPVHFQQLAVIERRAQIFRQARCHRRQTVMQLRDVIIVKQIRNIAAHNLVHMGSDHAGAVDHLIPHIQRLRFLRGLDPGHRHPVRRVVPQHAVNLAVGFAGGQGHQFIRRNIRFIGLNAVDEYGVLAGLEAEVFPNTDLRQQHAVAVGYHLPHAANTLGEWVTLRFIDQRHQFVTEA